jgi:hypothetical protein
MTDEDTPGGAPGGDGVTPRPNAKLGPQLITVSPKRWSPAAEERFLDELSTSANVERAAIAAGFSTHGIYARRRKDAGFADRWQAARAQGVARIEMALVEAAQDSMKGIAFDPDRPIPRMSVDQAIAVVRMFGEGGIGHRRDRRAPNWKPHDPEQARANILRKVAAVRRAKGYDA